MVDEANQLVPLIDAVPDRLAECALGSYARSEILEPTFEPGHDRCRLLLADGERILQRPFLSGPLASFALLLDLALDAVDLPDVIADSYARQAVR